ncbi:MAG: hypothetical protein CM15mP3_04900 [Candidatus Poseidoniales archaeon]|nr:MAG: hypothetical protein CM15mP3_04900 [Candidatus Poseidoniales archaeon]
MFFNIEFYPPYMSPEDLLRVEPEVLAKLILHKREQITQKLPGTIETIAEQKLTAEKLARQSRSKKDDLEPKVNNLIKERQNVVRKSRTNYTQTVQPMMKYSLILRLFKNY